MGYEEVTGGAESFTGEGAINKVEGLYRGHVVHHGEYKGKPTETQIHTFDNGGEIVRVYGKGQLDYKLASVPNGTWVRATHEGLDSIYHQFKVEIDKSRSEAAGTSTEEDDEMPV
ncbi:MAG: hypothetical protein GY718_00060 [Lentisphaerae bacterium]|nr:hypothetical protein [Lentisphaerota bacterium]